MSYDFAETCVFDKQSPGPGHCDPLCRGRPFFRSYGASLPSSLERVLSRPLVFSTYLPVSVSGTGNECVGSQKRGARAFLGSLTSLAFNQNKFQRTGSRLSSRIVFVLPVNALNASTAFHSQTQFSLLRPPVPTFISTGILTCLPSTTPFGLALGPDSPPTDEPCRGTLRFSGHWILTNVFVTQADILTSASSTFTYVKTSPKAERSPTDSLGLFALSIKKKINANKKISQLRQIA